MNKYGVLIMRFISRKQNKTHIHTPCTK